MFLISTEVLREIRRDTADNFGKRFLHTSMKRARAKINAVSM